MLTIPTRGDSRRTVPGLRISVSWDVLSLLNSLRLVNLTSSKSLRTSSCRSLGAQPVTKKVAWGAMAFASRSNFSAVEFPLTVHTFRINAAGSRPSLGRPKVTLNSLSKSRAIFSPSPKFAAHPWLMTERVGLSVEFFKGDSRVVVGEDFLVGLSCLGSGADSHLTHADSVAEAGTCEDPFLAALLDGKE